MLIDYSKSLAVFICFFLSVTDRSILKSLNMIGILFLLLVLLIWGLLPDTDLELPYLPYGVCFLSLWNVLLYL